jgi:hypothetical protein
VVSLLGCPESATLQDRRNRTVFAWMQCQDCMDDQRARVITMGDTVVPMLRDILINGPPPEHIGAVREMMAEVAQRVPPARAPSVALIEAQLNRYRAMYGLRAVSALSGIGSKEARQSLCEGRSGQRSLITVRQAIDSAIARFGGTCP